MALSKLIIIFAVVAVVVIADYNEVEAENKAKKAMAAKKEQSSRSANPTPVKGSFQHLTSLMNRTEERQNRRRGKQNFRKLIQLNRKQKSQTDDMMNDNEGALSLNSKIVNDSYSLTQKMKILRPEPSTYEAVIKYSSYPHVTGVFCNFENMYNSSVDMCMWQWNTTVSRRGLGFGVVTAADIVATNETAKGLMFSGPDTDADGNERGHFLYLPVDPTMENMVIKSPPFRGLWEFCKFEAWLHQSKMQNASIRLISESTFSGVQWILQEVAGNNFEVWQPFRFMVGKVQQEIRIIIEISKAPGLKLISEEPLPYIAVDNIKLVECLPEPPVFNGECAHSQLKCRILSKESCIKLQQVCDLVKDCDDGSDEKKSCDKMPYGAYCNFEHDTCGFENVKQPILKWSRHSGPTPTDKTGPNYDHTCGPPDLYTTSIPMVPPLFPAHMNHSMITCVGYYFFVNMNVTGPNKERADFASTAVMKTVVFNPPPKVHGNLTSKYYNCCMIRFYYQQNGRNYGSLSVDVVEITSRGNISTSVWFSTKDKGENWYRAAIFLPNVTRRYYLQFKTRMGMRIYSDSAIDDFSMAPECFGLNIDPEELGDYNYYDPTFEEKTMPHENFVNAVHYRFTTCGATGRYGPNQTMCDAAYNTTSTTVEVLDEPPFAGVQVWTVPNEGHYTIIAWGASGGLGSAWAGVSHAAQARVFLELHKGERLYMLVGQQGQNACKKTLSAQESQECSRQNGSLQLYTSKTHEVRNTHVTDGGGGGGGGTYVFLMNNGVPEPLVVAGGGGGLSVGVYVDDGSQHAHGPAPGPPESGYMYGNPGRTSGAGGGWEERSGPSTPGFELVRGAALREGGAGGRACSAIADGGFGGGGGGCLRGGGGGGWAGGNTNEAEGKHGGGGWSFVEAARAVQRFGRVSLAARTGPGEVLIVPAIHSCGCSYRCVVLNEYFSEVECICPQNWIFVEGENKTCISKSWLSEGKHILYLTIILVVFFGGAVVAGIACYTYNRYQKKRASEKTLKDQNAQDLQLRRLRPAAIAGDNLTMAFNPHYGSEAMLQGIDVRGLPKVARESLKLVKALGQGAFGEVYQGLYRHRSGDTDEMPVAVKTLPELSTGQAESDFLMEAAIMAKFSHPNIVHLIGVCFDRHPRFIVLELLAGGDLKTFLRESRPRPERASALCMKDLLLCAVDVCKGCRYLEAQRFIHRDIAARNCLLTSRGPGRCVKIADFGMARDIYRSDYYKKGGKAMLPIKWMPPEAYIDGLFTIKTDVWSFGVLLWEVFSLGVMPYTGCSNREVMDLVSGGGRLEKPFGCPQEVYKLMSECWNPNPEARPTFSAMFDRLSTFSKDPEITSAPLPMVRSMHPAAVDAQVNSNGSLHSLTGDYLVPTGPQDSANDASSTDQLVPHSKSSTAASDEEDSESLPRAKASRGYGRTRAGSREASRREACAAAADKKNNATFLPSKSTDRLLSSVEGTSEDSAEAVEGEESGRESETSFISRKVAGEAAPTAAIAATPKKVAVVTPTRPKPTDSLPKPIENNVIDRTNHKSTLAPEKKTAPIASPDPPRVNAWKDPTLAPKLKKPLCLDPAQLEKDLNDLKKNSGSVNLNTMNIVPPYIHVVTPNKLSESKTIQIDPKRAVIHDLPTPTDEEATPTIKPSSSAASLLNGPMTDVPYADSDNTSSESGNGQNNNKKPKINFAETVTNGSRSKPSKQGSDGGVESEINC